jgi:hypothetical protein
MAIMKAFATSSSGRILFFAFALAFAGTGVAKLLGPSGLAFGAISLFAGIAVAVVAFATAVSEHFASAALTVLILPWLLFVAEIGEGLVSSSASGYALVIAGLAAAAFALRPQASDARAPTAHAVAQRA